jgi:hypothetical protein
VRGGNAGGRAEAGKEVSRMKGGGRCRQPVLLGRVGGRPNLVQKLLKQYFSIHCPYMVIKQSVLGTALLQRFQQARQTLNLSYGELNKMIYQPPSE